MGQSSPDTTLAGIWSLRIIMPAGQRVTEIQESKRDLASILLNPASREIGRPRSADRPLKVCVDAWQTLFQVLLIYIRKVVA